MVEILIFRVDQFSFWIGFVGGLLFAWVISQAVKLSPVVLRALRDWIQTTRENLTTGTENRLRQDVLNWAQRQHLAAPLFALDEILVQPRLLAPAQYSGIDDRYEQLDIAALTVPYMPDWPEMASTYNAPTLSLVEALKGDSDLILIGQPGSGKTVALATLASQIARRDPELDEMARLFPLLVPAANLLIRRANQGLLETIIQAIAGIYVSPVVRPRLKSILRFLFQTGRILFMLDGLDELNPKSAQELCEFVGELKTQYPQIRMIVTARVDDFAGFNNLGFSPLAVAGWNESDKRRFIQKWHQQWVSYIEPDAMMSPSFVDTLLLERWLIQREVNYSPFDCTLKTWGTFSGDLLGPRRSDLIDAHICRMTFEFTNARDILQAIAVEMVDKLSPILHQREAENVANRTGKAVAVTPQEVVNKEADLSTEPEDQALREQVSAAVPAVKPSAVPRAVSTSHLISSLLTNGLLVNLGGSVIAFCHPLIMGYLAGYGMVEATDPPDIANQPDWTGKDITLGFYSALADISKEVERLLEKGRQTPIHHELFQVARWMQVTPQSSPWRPVVMRYLYSLLQKEYDTLSLAGRAVCALALSGDPGVGNLFRSLLTSSPNQLRQLGALGLGMVGEGRFVKDLASMTDDISPNVGRAACLGLVGIGNKPAMDSLITVLLHGSEEMRRAAAEALANQPQEGWNLLKEGLTMEDILVRRAVIHGLLRSKDPEVTGLLERTAIEDAQWVVRDAAAHALEQSQKPISNFPKPYKPLTQQSWLINFAGKSGVGVRDERHGLELVLQVLEQGEIEERMKALEYLRQYPHEHAIPRLYNLFFGSQDEIKDASFDVIWHSASVGLDLPPPGQFGLG